MLNYIFHIIIIFHINLFNLSQNQTRYPFQSLILVYIVNINASNGANFQGISQDRKLIWSMFFLRFMHVCYVNIHSNKRGYNYRHNHQFKILRLDFKNEYLLHFYFKTCYMKAALIEVCIFSKWGSVMMDKISCNIGISHIYF